MKNKNNGKGVKKVIIGFVVAGVVILLINELFFSGIFMGIPVKEELSQLQKIASEYKNKNGNYGIIVAKNLGNNNELKNCFAGNTFVKTPEATNILAGENIDNISCVFKTATGSPIIDAWSITIVKGEKAYCEDSTGVRRETPGLTTLHICNAE